MLTTTMNPESHSDITDWLNAAGRFPLLPPERINILTKQIQSLPNDSAKRKKLVNVVVNHNLRLVVRFVRGFLGSRCNMKWGCPETVDYLQVGAIGLMRAAERYDPTRGYAFSTYANHWIRSTVSRYNLKTFTPVSISESAARELIFYNRNGYFKDRNGKRRTSQEGLKIKSELEAAYNYKSLNATLENGGEFQDFVEDTSNRLDIGQFCEELHATMDSAGIGPTGKEILLSCYIEEEKPQETAEKLGITLNKYRSEKRRAVKLVRAHPELFGAGTL